jgi:hypothetical protein
LGTATSGVVVGITGLGQAGTAFWTTSDPITNFTHAVYWPGNGNPWIDLNAGSECQSLAHGISGLQIVGSVKENGIFMAALWSTDGSFRNLHPAGVPGIVHSEALATSGTQQVGYISMKLATMSSDHRHAALWSGTSESFIDLHPQVGGWTDSTATAISGANVVGSVSQVGVTHAVLWKATKPMIDLHPTDQGFWATAANGISGTNIVGVAFGNGGQVAVLWQGSRDRMVILSPAGSGMAQAYCACGSSQAGEVDNHAAFWMGTPESFVDLHEVLGFGTYSRAYAMVVDDSIAYVVGQVDQTPILWRIGLPTPDRPRFTSIEHLADGRLGITLQTAPGAAYRLEASTNLVDWLVVTNSSSSSGTVQFNDWKASPSPARFYRAVVLP